MTYEIRVQFEGNGIYDFRNVDYTDKATAVEFARKEGEDAIKYLKVGKKRWTWQTTPDADQFKRFYKHLKSFAVTVKEAETGRVIYSVKH